MKHEWRKAEKGLYLPKNHPIHILVPEMKFFTIQGKGNPNDPAFENYVAALYALSYAVRMSYKKGLAPDGYSNIPYIRWKAFGILVKRLRLKIQVRWIRMNWYSP